MDELKFS